MESRNCIPKTQRLLYGKTLRFFTGQTLGSVIMRTACLCGKPKLEDAVRLAFLHGILPLVVNS